MEREKIEQIRVLMKDTKTTNRELGERLGISESGVARKLKGDRPIGLNEVCEIFNYLNGKRVDGKLTMIYQGRTIVVDKEVVDNIVKWCETLSKFLVGEGGEKNDNSKNDK